MANSKLFGEKNKTQWVWQDVEPSNFVTTISAEQSDSRFEVEFKSEYVASYNWVVPRFGSPFMMIPGCPNRYKVWTGNLKVNNRLWYWYSDGIFNPKYPLESLFRAVNVCNSLFGRKDFNWQDIDICTDRDVLQRLFAISNRNWRKGDGPVRIDIELVGNIVTLTRVEEKYTGYSKDYCQAFRKRCSERLPGVPFSNRPGDGEFQCVKRVKFGGLTMMVRVFVEAADFSNVDDLVMTTIGNSMGNFEEPEPFDKDSSLKFTNSPKHFAAKKSNVPDILPVEHASSLVKFNTSAQKIDRKWPVMFFGGIETLITAKRIGEFVEEVDRIDFETAFKSDDQKTDELINLAKMLNVLVDLVRQKSEDELLVALWNPMEPTFEHGELIIRRRRPFSFIRAAPLKLLQELKLEPIM